jgi:hypothetical protein
MDGAAAGRGVIRLAVRVDRAHAEPVLAELLALSPGGLEERDVDAVTVEYALYGAAGELPELPQLRAAAGEALVDVSSRELPGGWDERWRDWHRPADIAGRAGAYDIPGTVVDGNDLWAVHAAAREAVDRARAGGGPSLLECQTYRHYGHSKADPAKYRPPGELERWLERDPLPRARARLLAEGVAEEQVVAVEGDVEARMERAVEAALAAPYPDPAAEAATEFAP